MNNILSGVNPPVVTIFDQHGRIDFEANHKQADFLIENGVDGLAYLGTTGEFSLLTVEEKKSFMTEMTEYINKRVHVIFGIGDTCLERTLELAHYAEEIGVDGILVVNPYFSVYESKYVEAYYDKIASTINLPIIIYNFPDLTGFCFNAELVSRLAQKHSNIVGIKDTINNFNHVLGMQSVKSVRPDFLVFSAFEEQALGLMVCGVDGFVNATANFAPEFTVKMFHAAKEGNWKEATIWYKKW